MTANEMKLDANRLGKVVLGEITLKRLKTHITECETCESPRYHVWAVRMGTKSLGTITFCAECKEHGMYGKKLFKPPANELITPFQVWIDENVT